MKTLSVSKVKVGSFAKVAGIVQAVFGFITGLVVTLNVAAETINNGTHWVQTLGVSLFTLGMAVLIFPLVGFVIGWVQGAIAAIIVNFAFKESGGLDVDVEEVK